MRHQGVASIGGLSGKAHSEDTWSVVDRLTLRAVLRRLAMANEPCLVHFCDDQQVEGVVGRVGRDFFELNVGEGAGRRGAGRAATPRWLPCRGADEPGRADQSRGVRGPLDEGCSRTNCSASA